MPTHAKNLRGEKNPKKNGLGPNHLKKSQKSFGCPLTLRTPLHGTHFHPKLLGEMKRQRRENQS
jgi:hypothetical protein